MGSECKKPRKSQPEIKVGVCTVGYKPEFLGRHTPIIICPYRYHTESVFASIANYYLQADATSRLQWASEVSIGPGGSVDFVLAKSRLTHPFPIDDFICIEFQAAGTTGTPWEAVKHFQATGAFTDQSYHFGINWANEFAKTMMQQVYKKAMIVASWNKRIIFVLQDVGLEYLRKAYDVSGLHAPARADDPIQFFAMRMDWDDGAKTWFPVPAEIVSTDLEGVRRILAGSAASEYITLEAFVANIKRRLQ